MKSDTPRLPWRDAHRVHNECCWQELGGTEDVGSKQNAVTNCGIIIQDAPSNNSLTYLGTA